MSVAIITGSSGLVGEASVNLYKNSLILRLCMTEKPFVHRKAFTNVKTNFIFLFRISLCNDNSELELT